MYINKYKSQDFIALLEFSEKINICKCTILKYITNVKKINNYGIFININIIIILKLLYIFNILHYTWFFQSSYITNKKKIITIIYLLIYI